MLNTARAACVALSAFALAAAPAAAAPNNNNSEKLRKAVTLENLLTHQQNFQTIADAAGGNRFAGLDGHDMSAEYVYEQLKAAGYEPRYQEFTYDAFFEKSPSQLTQVSPTPTTYVNGNDFRIMSYSGSGTVEAPLGLPTGNANGCTSGDFGDLTGRIALVQRGTCTFRIKTDNAAAAGAVGVLIYNNVDGVVNGTLGATGLSTIPSFGLTKALGDALAAQVAGGTSVTMRMFADTGSEELPTRNVIAETPGDPNNVVVVGAHLDSVSQGPGINDNASGSSAILETAIQMAKVKPRNQVRFAWWSAEESGLIGAQRYVDSLSEAELGKIALNLNFDMIASPNYGLFVYDGDNSKYPPGTGSAEAPPGSDVIERLFYGFFEGAGEYAEPTPFSGRSDYGPFIAKGIPAGGLFTGAEQPKTADQVIKWGGTAGVAYDFCYHAACDDIGNLANRAFDVNADAIAHATITFAQSTNLINGVRGKGNFNDPYLGAGDGADTGTGSGGGLHADHDHDEES